MSIFCPFCGEKLVDEAKFCKNCGKNVEDYHKSTVDSTNNYSYNPPVAEKSHTLATVVGFICSVLIPLFGFIFGIYLITRKDNPQSKKYGIIIIVISVIVWIISFAMAFMAY